MEIINRVKNLIMTPQEEFKRIKKEKTPVSDLFTRYVIILAAIPPVCGLIGGNLFGASRIMFPMFSPYSKSLTVAVLSYLASIGGVFVLGFAIDALAPSFGCQKDSASSFKIAAYAPTAAWGAGALNLITPLSFLSGLLGLYSIYLLYAGLKTIKDVPKEKFIAYFAATLAVSFVISAIIGLIISSFTFSSYWMSGYKGF